MKKYLIALSMILTIVLLGCSNETIMHEPTEADFDRYVFYDFDSMSFEFPSEDSLMIYFEDDYIDFNILYTISKTSTATSSEPSMEETYAAYIGSSVSFESTLSKLEQITDVSGISLGALADKTLSELNEVATQHGIVLTIDDIVQFYDFQNMLAYVSGSYRVTMQTYFEHYLDRDLESSEILSLELLQNNYSRLCYEYGTYDLSEKTIDDIQNDLAAIGISNLTQDDLDAMASALALVQSLIEE